MLPNPAYELGGAQARTSQLDQPIVPARSASSNSQSCQLDQPARPARRASSTSQLDRQIVPARSADLGDRGPIDLADSTFHGYRRHGLTISLSTQLASHDLQRSACIVSSFLVSIFMIYA